MFTMLIEKAVDDNCSKFFIKSILLYIRKPQLVNKKLSHSTNIVTLKLNELNSENDQIKKNLQNLSTFERDEVIQCLSEHADETDVDFNQIQEAESGNYLIVNRLEPRDVKKFLSRIVGIIVGKILIGFCNLLEFIISLSSHFRHQLKLCRILQHQRGRRQSQSIQVLHTFMFFQ